MAAFHFFLLDPDLLTEGRGCLLFSPAWLFLMAWVIGMDIGQAGSSKMQEASLNVRRHLNCIEQLKSFLLRTNPNNITSQLQLNLDLLCHALERSVTFIIFKKSSFVCLIHHCLLRVHLQVYTFSSGACSYHTRANSRPWLLSSSPFKWER